MRLIIGYIRTTIDFAGPPDFHSRAGGPGFTSQIRQFPALIYIYQKACETVVCVCIVIGILIGSTLMQV